MKRDFELRQPEHTCEGSAAGRLEGPKRLARPGRRTQVLRHAATQFAITGLRGTTTLMLARAGISEPILHAHFGSKECLFREAVKDNIETRLQVLEARTTAAVYESETAAVQLMAEDTVTVCVASPGNSILTNWALLEDPRYAADLYRHEIGSIETLWIREFSKRFPNSRSHRILSVHLVPFAVSACLAYGFWLAALRHDPQSAEGLAQGFAAGIGAQAASALLSEQS